MNKDFYFYLLIEGLPISIIVILCATAIFKAVRKKQLENLNKEVLKTFNLTNWKYRNYDAVIDLKSSRSVDEYSETKFFKENREKLEEADKRLNKKSEYAKRIAVFLQGNEFENQPMYNSLKKSLIEDLESLNTYNISVRYVSPAGRSTNFKTLSIDRDTLDEYINNPALFMSKSEYNKYIKEQNKMSVDEKCHSFYEKVNSVIDVANDYRSKIIISGDKESLDKLISSLFDKTVNSIKKIKTLESEEWLLIDKIISDIQENVTTIISNNKQILDYYDSEDFKMIKEICTSLMESKKDFNDYINEKAKSISSLFGFQIMRNETEINDEYNYIRPYKKEITPFTAEVSAQVFASAENSPLEYIVKYFYPNKELYPEQIQKLQLLVEELETLKDAKRIIDNYKKDFQQYLYGVPKFIMDNDENGFYTRLGFADISENILTVQYKFAYTSNGGFAQRSFTVPMTEDTVIRLIDLLQSKLTMSTFAKEQRSLMTSKLRQQIKERDNFTCKYCGNSTHNEENLLLEIDHIMPVSKGGYTIESNLQTLCWKCNRAKSSKIMD